MTPHPQFSDLKAIEYYIYSSMNHTPEWKRAEEAIQRILTSSNAKSEREQVLDETTQGVVIWSPAHIFRLICRLNDTEFEYLLSDIRWLQEKNFKKNHPELRKQGEQR